MTNAQVQMECSEEVIVVEHYGERLTLLKTQWGCEIEGRAASQTGFLNHSGCVTTEEMQALGRGKIERFLAAPYLVGSHDYKLWRGLGICPVTARNQIRIPEWHTGEVWAVLLDLGFEPEIRTGLFLLAPQRMSRSDLQILLKPVAKMCSRQKPEKRLVAELLQKAHELGDRHKQVSFF